MERDEARRKLQKLLIESGRLAPTPHAKQRMIERHFTMPDIIRAIQSGKMIEGPMSMDREGCFECVMQTRLDDGRMLKVPVIVDETAKRIIIKSTVRTS